ncbi:hypothetical protein CEXT_677801 [Caerostris extrusa]|uniref:Ribosomal protein S11 n=1 Tax=Caerostris extrusa TaxID=172846 RepID=A0AAV4NWR6_CAEEX|nr:hypothetical protein CEXT_677801 [Caerostris extrusa]
MFFKTVFFFRNISEHLKQCNTINRCPVFEIFYHSQTVGRIEIADIHSNGSTFVNHSCQPEERVPVLKHPVTNNHYRRFNRSCRSMFHWRHISSNNRRVVRKVQFKLTAISLRGFGINPAREFTLLIQGGHGIKGMQKCLSQSRVLLNKTISR